MGMSTDEWRLLISTRATGRGDRTAGRNDNSCGALIDGRGERHTAFIDHMPEHPSDEYRQLHEWADGYGWMLTPDADRLADRIIDGMDPHPTPAVMAALAACYPDRLIMADTRAVRRPAERWFHEAGPLRLDRYMRGGADDDGTAAYPKIATIVNVTELSERTVRTALKTLQERGFIRRGDQRYARLGKGGRNRLPQYCQIVWDLAVESDPSTLEWIKETHTAEHDPKTMGKTVDPEAGTVFENGESKGVTPENAGTKPIPSTANLAGLEKGPEPALQIPQGQHCESCTPSTANAAGLLYKDKTLQVNPPSKPSFPSAPTGHLPASGATAAEKNKTEQLDEDDTEIAEAAGRVLASLGAQRSMLGLATPSPTKADRKAIIGLYRRLVDQGAQWPTLVMVDAIGFAMNGDWWPKRIRTGRALARHWDELNDDMILAAGRTDGDAHAQTVPAAESTEPDAAPWLPDWAVKTLAELDGQDATAGGEATA